MSILRNKLKTIFLLSFLFVSSIGSAQTLEQLETLSALGASAEEMGDSDIPTSRATEEATEFKSTEETRKEKQAILDKEGEDFGFSGRSDFLVAPKPKGLEKSLKYFGYDYFINGANTFAPIADIPIPSDYILGPGDEIKIILFGNKNKKYTLEVTRDGDVFFPDIGPITVAGLTFLDLKETIKEIVENQIIGTKVSLTLGALRSINIFVLGEASQPGMYTINSLSTLTNAIFASGGIKTTGSLRGIEVKRNGNILSTFDFYDVLLKGDTRNDVRLMTGDVVFIPPITKKVGIAGEVERPGIYELKGLETAEDLINYAGTLKPKADLSSVEVQTIDSQGNGFNLKKIDLKKSSFSELPLKNGDTLTIYPVVNRMKGAILLSGHAQKPGFYPWTKDMKVLDLLNSTNDLLPMTDINYALIKREDKTNQKIKILQIDLEELFKKRNSDLNLILNERDEIILFPSMLTSDLINVRVIEGQYDNQDDQESLAYTMKSIKDMESITKTTISEDPGLPPKMTTPTEEEKFFQYSIYDYCPLSGSYVMSLLGASGTLPPGITLTDNCRRAIIDPIVDLLVLQSNTESEQQIFDIYGNVDFPGRYPLAANASLDDIFKAAGGLNNESYLSEIEIISREFQGKQILRKRVTKSFIRGNEEVIVEPLDQITVKKLSETFKTATLEGEVFFPGTYPITEGETLSSLLKRAGGLKGAASLKAAIFQRESLKTLEMSRLKKLKEDARRNILLTQQSLGTEEGMIDISALERILDTEITEEDILGRLVIDLQGIVNQDFAKDIILENGDVLTIPKLRSIVSVIGEVYVPNSHVYQDDLRISDYINLSGGSTNYADPDSAYIIKADGSISSFSKASSGFFRGVNNELEPGDTIVLPIKLDRFSALKATTEITQIIYQMSLAAAAVNSF